MEEVLIGDVVPGVSDPKTSFGSASAAGAHPGTYVTLGETCEFRLPESVRRPGEEMDARELLHAVNSLKAIEDVSYLLAQINSIRDRLEASFLSGASPSRADTLLAADSVRWFQNASIVASRSSPSRAAQREARVGNYKIEVDQPKQSDPLAMQWVRDSTRQVEQARMARVNVERQERLVREHAANAGTVSCTWPEFRIMATEFFHEIDGLAGDEGENAWKCLSLAYLGIESDEIAKYQAVHLFSLAKNKYVEFQCSLGQASVDIPRQRQSA